MSGHSRGNRLGRKPNRRMRTSNSIEWMRDGLQIAAEMNGMTVKKAIVSAFCIGLLMGVALFVSQIPGARREVRQIGCVHNLKLLGMALHQYAIENAGRYPDTWNQLYPEFLSDDLTYVSEVFRCPEQRRDKDSASWVATAINDPFFETVSYVIVPGRRRSDGPNTILAYEAGDNHLGIGRAELYVDGHCGWNPPANYP